jgi:sialate O-acetylesterase
MKKYFLLITFCVFAFTLNAQLRLPKLVSDGMILQRQTALKIWGWDNEGSKFR